LRGNLRGGEREQQRNAGKADTEPTGAMTDVNFIEVSSCFCSSAPGASRMPVAPPL